MTRGWQIAGRVQGVGFRYFVARAAAGLGLTGWTRNLPDGTVEVVAQGPDAALAELASALATGPRRAVVARVTERQISDEIEVFNSFEVM